MTLTIILLIVLVLLILYVVATYNNFVTTKTRITASIQEIGNQLKRQTDLIPNLVDSVKGYMKHEKSIFKDLTDARKAVMGVLKSQNAQKMIDAGSKLQQALAPIMAVFESTPQLQAAGPTTQLMEELRDTADKVMYSRRTLIDLTADYNIMVVTVPSSLIAGLFGFTQLPGLKMPEVEEGALEVSKEEMKTPKVKLD
jgi:LemA protein